ncbi:MAG: tetratricopeptide repeat protein, partial [Acidobacteriota bacterium]|nr:tetratricopeptide repeat protein [Acidobacteriota bacterium]
MKVRAVALRSHTLLGIICVTLYAAGVTCLAREPAEQVAAIFAQGQAALTKGDLATAETYFRQVLEREPNSVPAQANLGVVYMRRRQWTKALEQFQTAERLAPGNPGLEIDIGLAYFRQEDFTAAIKPFEAVLQNNPSSLQARYLVGLCLFATEKYSQAIESLKSLWSSENNKMTYLYVLALTANKA